MTRRKFLQRILPAVFLAPVIGQIWTGCSHPSSGVPDETQLLDALGETLFPGQPSIKRMHFSRHFRRVIDDSHFDSEARRFMRWGWGVFRRFVARQVPDFARLEVEKRHGFVQSFAEEDPANEEWLGLILEVLWESVLLDPYYGVNTHMEGWKWLHHSYGTPRPEAGADYETLVAKWSRSEIIRSLSDLG